MALAAGSTSTPAAFAQSSDTNLQRLATSRKADRYNVVMPGTTKRGGGAAIYVNAPMDTVRKIVTDYGHYSELASEFRRSRIIGKKDGATDVYLEVSILKGAAKVYSLTRFYAPVKEGAQGERIDSSMVEGSERNVDDLRGVWHYQAIDENHTLLKLEFLVVPRIPLPSALVVPELESSADKVVTSVRNRAEAKAIQSNETGTARSN